MKKIILIRHAKSDWSVEGIPDFERPLNQRGYSDAHIVGTQLQNSFSGKIKFVSSPAIRAYTTARIIMSETGKKDSELLLFNKLYEAEAGVYYELISETENEIETLVVFGHNPTISTVVSRLVSQPEFELPTCASTGIFFETDHWKNVASCKGKMFIQLFPRHLK